jgi:aspartate racemase
MNRNGIIIGGGVGPMAGVKLHEKIIEFTATDGSDQDHLDVVHLSRSRLIGDRTKFLLGEEMENPGKMMATLISAAADSFSLPLEGKTRTLVTGVPCNTFHAPPVWDAFIGALEEASAEKGTKFLPVHMLDSCLAELSAAAEPGAAAGILSTRGTAKSGVWRQALEAAGFRPVEVEQELQQRVHQAIYNPQWGLKALSPAGKKARSELEFAAETLRQKGATLIILGCTEIPLALPEGLYKGALMIDPVSSLARAMIRKAGGSVKTGGSAGDRE